MGRNELYISVPSQFRCPISLDVMKSPVSLCTGVTYDRSNIQHWLESGHDTCPATMQVLSTKEFTPNLTLQSLISLWTPPPPLSDHQLRAWMADLTTLDSAVKLADFATASDRNRSFLANFDGFLEAVACVLGREGVEVGALEMVVRVLDSILVESGAKEKLRRFMPEANVRNSYDSLATLLRRSENPKSKAEAVRVLESMTTPLCNGSKRFAAEMESLLPVLVHLLRTQNDPELRDSVLSLLTSVSTARPVRTRLVELGLVGLLSRTLSDEKAAVSAVEKSLKLLSGVATCAEGRLAMSEEAGCVEAIVGRLMKVSKRATEDAVVVLWSLCCVLKEGRVQEKAAKSNGVVKVLLVMQSLGEEEGSSSSVRRMCEDLLKVLRRRRGLVGDEVGSYETKTIHIMPF